MSNFVLYYSPKFISKSWIFAVLPPLLAPTRQPHLFLFKSIELTENGFFKTRKTWKTFSNGTLQIFRYPKLREKNKVVLVAFSIRIREKVATARAYVRTFLLRMALSGRVSLEIHALGTIVRCWKMVLEGCLGNGLGYW